VPQYRTVADRSTDDLVREFVSDFKPHSSPPAASSFARYVVSLVEPETKSRAKALLFATSKLACFGLSVGLELRPEVLLHESVIERFSVYSSESLSRATRLTLRSNLRYVADRVLGCDHKPKGMSRERVKDPYSNDEISAYLRLCDSQPTIARRFRTQALICLGAGAGLIGTDLRQMRGSDVVCRSGGVLVTVKGSRPRVVPVIASFQDRLLSSSRFSGSEYLIGGSDPYRKNVTTRIISSLSGGADMERLSVRRLRATWLETCAASLGLRAFMDAAGVTCSQRFGDICSRIDSPDEKRAVALLGASR
jgi:integrase